MPSPFIQAMQPKPALTAQSVAAQLIAKAIYTNGSFAQANGAMASAIARDEAAQAKKEKLPPMNCKRCNFRNEYVGKEHLDSSGGYTCRGCK